MSDNGGPVTLDERVRSSSCTGVSGNCSVVSSLRPSTRYYIRFCGELFAPDATGYHCFDSTSDEDPPNHYDSFITPASGTAQGPNLSGRLYTQAGGTVTPGSYDVVVSMGGVDRPGIWTVELRVDGELVGLAQPTCTSPCGFIERLWFNTAVLPAGSHAFSVIARDPARESYVRSWSIDADPTQTVFVLSSPAPYLDVLQAVGQAPAEWLELNHSGAGQGGLILGSQDPVNAIIEYVAFYAAEYGGNSNPQIREFRVGGSVPTAALGSLASLVTTRHVSDPFARAADAAWDVVEDGPDYPDALLAEDVWAESQPFDPRESDPPSASAADDPPGKTFSPLYGLVNTYHVSGSPQPRRIIHTLTFPREAVGDLNGDGDKKESPFERDDAPDHGYEHDFKLFDPTPEPGRRGTLDGCTMEKENFWAQRAGYTWTSNFPEASHPYFDTDVSDTCETLDFTIGLEYPLELSPGMKYEIRIRTRAGDQSFSHYKLRSVMTARLCTTDPRDCAFDDAPGPGTGGADGEALAGPGVNNSVRTMECRRWRKGYRSRRTCDHLSD